MSEQSPSRAEPAGFLARVFHIPSEDRSSCSIYNDDNSKSYTPSSPDPSRPYVTLTFAQSLDAKIAGVRGKQMHLSGMESLIMTHWMRTLHDGILVGIGTALNDNPQLNTRHLPSISPNRYHLPRPIILDQQLRLSPHCKLLENYREGKGRRPWIVCAPGLNAADRSAVDARRQALSEMGARIVEVPANNGMISIPELLVALRDLGIRSLMVEGGARIIQSFLAAAKPSEDGSSPAVDMVIITVAPTIVGTDAVGYGANLLAEELPALEHLETQQFGKDTVIALKIC